MMLTSAGADGVFGAASEMPILRDTRPALAGDAVHVPPAPRARDDVEPKTVRVASSAGGVDTAPVTSGSAPPARRTPRAT